MFLESRISPLLHTEYDREMSSIIDLFFFYSMGNEVMITYRSNHEIFMLMPDIYIFFFSFRRLSVKDGSHITTRICIQRNVK